MILSSLSTIKKVANYSSFILIVVIKDAIRTHSKGLDFFQKIDSCQ